MKNLNASLNLNQRKSKELLYLYLYMYVRYNRVISVQCILSNSSANIRNFKSHKPKPYPCQITYFIVTDKVANLSE